METKYVKIGKYWYSAHQHEGRWYCNQGASWGPTPETACREYHTYLCDPNGPDNAKTKKERIKFDEEYSL